METKKINRKKKSGVVVSDKSDKTISVLVSRFVKHPKYEKFLKKSKRYQAHDEHNSAQNGDRVEIEECNPISKSKRFRLISTDSPES